MLKNKNGMTLIEIIIAFALLAILVTAFVFIFSTSLVNIMDFGNKSSTLAEANKAFEAVYSIQNPDYNLIDTELNSLNGSRIDNAADLYALNDGKDFNYFIEIVNIGDVSEDIIGFKVTIVGFYRGGEKYVDLFAFVRGS